MHLRHSPRISAWIMMAASLGLLAAPAPAAPVAAVQFDSVAIAAAIAPNTGAVAVADEKGNVTLYPKLGAGGGAEGSIKRSTGAPPVAIVHKLLGDRSVFLVFCKGQSTVAPARIHALDDQTLEPLKTLQLPVGVDPTSVAAPAMANVPYVYVAIGTEAEAKIHRLDLETFTVQPLALPGNREAPASIIGCSADGAYLYGTGARRQTNSTGVFVFGLPRGKDASLQLTPVINQPYLSIATLVPDALGHAVAHGTTLMSPDWAKTIAKDLPVVPAAFFNNRPLFVGLKGTDLIFVSTNTFKTVGQATLPMAPLPAAGGTVARDRQRLQAVLADPSNGSVVLCRGDMAFLVTLADAKVKPEPFLDAVVDGPRDLITGVAVTLKITCPDPQTQLKLVQGPPNLKLAGNQITWTPGPGDVGAARVQFSLSVGQLERMQEFELVVRRPSLDLPFRPVDMSVSADGKMAVVLNRQRETADPASQEESRLALVDLQKMVVIAERTLPARVQNPSIDGHYVYLAGLDTDLFYVLSRNDLSDVRRIFTKSRLTGLQPVADKFLFAGAYDDRNYGRDSTPSIYRLPELELLPSEGTGLEGRVDIPKPVGQRWYYKGALYDARLEKVLFCEQAQGLPALPMARDISITRDSSAPPIALWSTVVQGGNIRRFAGQSVGKVEGGVHALLPDLPAVAALVNVPQTSVPSGSRPLIRWDLVIADLHSAKVVQRYTLSNEPPPPPEPSTDRYSSAVHRLHPAPGSLVALIHKRIYVIPTNNLDPAKFKPPLHFPLPQIVAVLQPDSSTILEFPAAGGVAPLEYSLPIASPWSEIDPKTGQVTIDTRKCMDVAVKAIVDRAATQQFTPRIPTTQPAQADARVAELQAATAARFKELTGSEPAGLAVSVPIAVQVRDAEHQSTTLHMAALLDVPLAAVTAVLRQREQESAVQRSRIDDQPRMNTISERMNQLERQVHDLELQNRLLKELLQGKISPATQPAE